MRHAAHVWFMCDLCVIYVGIICGLCVIHMWFMCDAKEVCGSFVNISKERLFYEL